MCNHSPESPNHTPSSRHNAAIFAAHAAASRVQAMPPPHVAYYLGLEALAQPPGLNLPIWLASCAQIQQSGGQRGTGPEIGDRAAADEERGPRSETERRPTRDGARDRRQSGGRRGTGPEIGDRATTDLVVRLRTAGVSRSHRSLKKEDDCWWQRQLRGRSWVA